MISLRDKNIEIFKKALMITDKCFPPFIDKNNEIYMESYMNIEWSEDSVESIFNAPENKRIGVLNFADGYTPGGLVWQGESTQEECLCRASNLYGYLEKIEYPIDGKLVYTKDVVFFMRGDGKLISPRKVDVITCPAPVHSLVDAKRRMLMILDAARLNGVSWLILGKWGCGAFGNDWEEYKVLWRDALGERHMRMDLEI